MKVTIFGAGGYVGKALAEACRARGDAVHAVSSRDGGIQPDTGLVSPAARLPAGTQVVYFLSQSPYYRDVPGKAPHLLSVNCVAAVQAAAMAVAIGAHRFIYASTGNVYAPSFLPISESAPVRRDLWYPLSKLMGEEAVSLFRDKLEVSVLRIFGIYGPGQTDKLIPALVDSVKAGRPILADRNPVDAADEGGLRFTPIYIDDAVNACLELQVKPVIPLLNLGGDRELAVASIAREIGRQLAKPVRIDLAGRERQTDLIADISLLRASTSLRFTSFEAGLEKVLQG